METVARYLLILLVLFPTSHALAETPQAQGEVCPVNLDLNQEERDAMVMFHARLSHLNDHYGKPTFQKKLNQIIADNWPTQKVIEISPSFMEKILALVDQAYLKDSIASTIGLDSPLWWEFERVMKKVTLLTYTTENKYGGFTRKVEALVNGIKLLNRRTMKTPDTSEYQRGVLKATAITQIANMTIFLGRWDAINREITKQRGEAAGRQFLFNAMTFTAGSVLVASIVFAGPIVATAGTIGGAFATNAVVAVQLARLGMTVAHATRVGQVLGGVVMGAAGAPTGQLLTDSTSAVMAASNAAANGNTVYACELDKQMKEWRRRGVSPYLKSAAIGGLVGMGGLLTLTGAGSKIVLAATSFGVGIAQLYSVGQMNDNSMKALAEYRFAIEAQEAGDNSKARMHLNRSRMYAKLSSESALEGIIVAGLTISIGGSLKTALVEGENAIRVIFANSSDTLPMALGIANDSVQGMLKAQ